MKKVILFIVLALILLSPFVVSKITLSNPETIYNLGDKIYITVDGLKGSNSGNLNIDLICGNKTVNLVKIPGRAFSDEQEQRYSVPYKILNEDDLEINNLNSIIGTCQIASSMGSDSVSTRTFIISNKIFVSTKIDKIAYNPGENINISINAVKENGNLLDGFIEASNASSLNKAISNGLTVLTFSMPESAESGIYTLKIIAFDNGKNGTLNKGEGIVYFEINQVPSSLVLSLSGQEVVPGNNLTVGAEIYDQSGKTMEGVVSIKAISPNNEEEFLNVLAGDFSSFDFPFNATAGTWQIISEFDGIFDNREFQVLGIQKVEFEIDGSILTIKNIGNTVYNKTISIKIGDEKRNLEGMNIQIGEIRKFNLKAPNGKYAVVIDDGNNSISKDVFLTGNAISIDNIKDGRIFSKYWIIWIFLIVILAGTGIVLFIRFKKTKTMGEGRVFGKIKSLKSGTLQPTFKEKYDKDSKNIVDLTKNRIKSAESALVLKGEKYHSAVITLHIKNYSSMKNNSRESLSNIIENVGKNMGLVDWKEDYIFIIFSPIITKTYNNESLAIKTGSQLLNNLREHNKKFNNKIEFNIGIHSGELISSKEESKLKYTSIGNTISFSKKMADSNNDKLLVSDEIRKKLVRDIKVVKTSEIGNNNIYEVSEVKNREANEAKLKDLLKRI